MNAAVRVLNTDPDAGLEKIAVAAGVTRQTVYAHFPSREHVLLAILGQVTQETVAAMDAAAPETGPAADALLRLLDAATQTVERYSAPLLQKISLLPLSPQADHEQHTPIAARIERVIRRGRKSGEFDAALPTGWLVAATIKLAHTASEEEQAGRLSKNDAQDSLHTSLLRMLGARAK
ncbi:TetR/AcrR family transcriptional regulator [Allorhizocola rhizosphaerae]|uniref:TetR/AcrR family transcriptional regulator n=1 Tax=Allorhizocola rhizosphaerae TaxID=1872709 RepID=UPI001B8C5289|nr:TetR/AcrR family transcriptional regulator [Allorhizocola rhizosphaerae]